MFFALPRFGSVGDDVLGVPEPKPAVFCRGRDILRRGNVFVFPRHYPSNNPDSRSKHASTPFSVLHTSSAYTAEGETCSSWR